MAEIQQAIIAELPHLRRYASCVTGSPSQGDELIEVALRNIFLAREHLDAHRSRLRLFKAFHAHLDPRQMRCTVRNDDSIKARLLDLPLLQRQAVVLSETIGFSLPEVADILGRTEAEVRRLRTAALRNLANARFPVLVVEDDAMVALQLGNIVRDMGLKLTGLARNKAEAIRLSGERKPALIIADYKLQHGETGVEVVESVSASSNPAVIYVTGYADELHEHLVNGDAVVISKPFNVASVANAVKTQLPEAVV